MIDPELKAMLDGLSAKIDVTYLAAEKTRKYIWWTVIITIAIIVVPLLILPFAANSLLSTYSGALGM